MLLGLSILVASISFLFYRQPPSSWTFLERLQRPSIQDIAKKDSDAPTSATNHDRQVVFKDIHQITNDAFPIVRKAEVDRKAMPPPPKPFIRPNTAPPSPPTTLRASSLNHTAVPTFNLIDGNDESDEELAAPSFPAANSAQRASRGRGAPLRQNPLRSSPALMAPPPSRSSLPNRSPTTSSLAVPPTHNAIPAKPRKKVHLTHGHSPLDWARLTATTPSHELAGLSPSTPYLRVPPSLLKQYSGRKGKDAWSVLGGKVYNITPYLPYHPGGEPELMKCAGRDGTRLFGEIHPWVNWEGMLEGCLVGFAVEEGQVMNQMDEMD